MLADDGRDLVLSADVSPALAGVALPGEPGGTLLESLCRSVDEVGVAVRRHEPEAVAREVIGLMETAQEFGVTVEVGVRTGPAGREEGAPVVGSVDELVIRLDQIYRRLVGQAGFAGFAVGDYRGLVQLIEKTHAH